MLSPSQPFQTNASYHGTKGVLTFDGKRLTFSYTSGMFSKHERVPVSIPSSMITEANVEGAVFKKLIVRTSEQGTIPRYEFQVAEPHRWATWLSSEAHRLIQGEERFVREIVREVRVLVKCSHCGFHAEQGTIACPTCGGPL